MAYDLATKQAVLSAVRSLLMVVGSGLAARGFITEGSVDEIIGALMVILPALWGIWDKFHAEIKTQEREVVAVNAGIAVSNMEPQETGKASPEEALQIIKTMSPTGGRKV